MLEHIGLGSLAQPWIGQESTALPVIMAITVWQWTGLTFVLYFAAMSQIDQSRARGGPDRRRREPPHPGGIIWPGVRGTTLALGILERHRCPEDVRRALAGHRSAVRTTPREFLGTYIYRKTIAQSHVGYGAALSVILLVLALCSRSHPGTRPREGGGDR